jgi:PAS domain S-box-containing protein
MRPNDPVSRVPFADAVFDSLQDEGLFVLGSTGIIVFCNAGAAILCGIGADELCGTHVSRLYPREEAELGLPARDLRAAADGGRLLRDGWLVRGDGGRFWGETTITALRAADGTLLGFSRVTRDLTERVAMEAALRRSEAKFSGIVSLASDAIICINDAQRITLFNRGAERMFGYDADRVLGEPLDVLLTERVRAAHRQHVHGFARSADDARRMGERAEIFGVRRGGEEFPAEAAISHQELEGERILTVVLRDVTERKRVELEIASLLAAEQGLRAQAQAAERRARLLAAAGELLAADPDPEAALARVAELAVEKVADACTVHLFDGDGALWAAAGAHADPAHAHSLRREHDPLVRLDGAAARVIAAGVPELVEEAAPEGMGSPAPRTWVCAPVLARGETLGLITLEGMGGGRRLSADDVSMASELATQVAVALQNARLRREAEDARREAEGTAERIQRLQTVTAALSGARTPGEVARAILGDGARIVGSHAGVLGLISDDGASLALLAPTGYPGDVAEAWTHVPLDVDLPLAEAVRTGQPVLVSSPEALDDLYPSLTGTRGRTGTEALAAVPLVADGRVMGAMGFSFPQPREFDEADRAFLDALAGQCAQALTRARLYESEVAAHAAAEAAVHARDEVMRVVAHDMGNSLSAILITTAVLLRRLSEAGVGDATVEAIRNIRLTAAQMKRLRDDLLDLATIEAGRLSVICSPYGPRRMLDEAVAQLAPLAHDKGIRLYVEAEAELPDVFADRDRVGQVLGNLGGNGIKFTPAGGEVRFRAGVDGDGAVRFLVSDTGPGIPEADRDHVFDRFWKSEMGNRHGAGLGLAIARGIVEAHGGRMWLEGTGPEGTTFAFTLPRDASSVSGGGLDESRPDGEVDEILAAPQP